MQSYHSGWYTIFVLNKINLIESFKEYLIGLKDILNFFKSFKIQSQLGSYILLGSLLSPNCFVICFRFSFSTHWLLLTRSLHSFISSHARLLHLHLHLHSYGHLSDDYLPHSHGRLNMKILICFIGVFVIIVTRVCNV